MASCFASVTMSQKMEILTQTSILNQIHISLPVIAEHYRCTEKELEEKLSHLTKKII